ncbi:hypothetical protein L1785_11140 [Antribacter sp. KLBMP9083]|uniref:Tetratricopeptide repeat protein n=1 Tax=Antribacter soli TaxID=2910976 RepID=A0AA41QF59_9MICO|nr:hypothetical protein [Antribacter soli]MCF4121536.1 hypothetical protein [Antribacter soli]
MRGLTKDNAEQVGLHLVMAGRLLEIDPERAYEHAQAAVRRGGRVDIVREAAGIAAYRTGRYAEALRELRTVRRLNGSSEHLPIMADAERGLGRPERAIALAASDEAGTLDALGRTELAIVVSGARTDLGEHDAALAVLDKIPADEAQGDLGLRVLQARAIALEAAGRTEEADALLATVDPKSLERAIGASPLEDDVVVYDVYDEEADLGESEQDDDSDEDDEAPEDELDDDLGDDEDEPSDPSDDDDLDDDEPLDADPAGEPSLTEVEPDDLGDEDEPEDAAPGDELGDEPREPSDQAGTAVGDVEDRGDPSGVGQDVDGAKDATA